MPNKFEIARSISHSKRRPGHNEVVVDFQGQSVTRHIINGVGRHPDDAIPGLHKRLHERVNSATQLVRDKKAAIELLNTNKPKGWEDLAAKMQREITSLEVQLLDTQTALAVVEKEDPLMVKYFLA